MCHLTPCIYCNIRKIILERDEVMEKFRGKSEKEKFVRAVIIQKLLSALFSLTTALQFETLSCARAAGAGSARPGGRQFCLAVFGREDRSSHGGLHFLHFIVKFYSSVYTWHSEKITWTIYFVYN